jgi:hypothetical protein
MFLIRFAPDNDSALSSALCRRGQALPHLRHECL